MMGSEGTITERGVPVLKVEGETIPEVWENAVLSCWEEGVRIKTEYDKPDDPPSRDCSMVMVIREPLGEPRIHRAFPGGLEDLEVYRLEVVDGIHDSWIDPDHGKWSYTYHERLFSYPFAGERIDQIEYAIAKLAQTPCTRRAQAITWNVKTDRLVSDPPCLQRFWFRLTEAADGMVLSANAHWRSRDAYKAAFMNLFALTDLVRAVAGRLSDRLGRPVAVGRYAEFVDSFHIYGSYFGEFEGFLKTVKNRRFEDRVWNSSFAEPFFAEARKKVRGTV
ncbi:MAG TPA: thymidylate synthase [bacterium]|nr:thymidylate synthase [bacterium]